MTRADLTDMITILQHDHDLLGVDKKRAKELIEAMSRIYTVDPLTAPDVAEAIKAVEDVTNYTLLAIQVRCRKRELVEARQIMAYTLRKTCGLSLKQTGRIIARDHSDVVHCVNVVEHNPRIFSERIKEIQTRLNPPSASEPNQTR
jgi:chromosomal replication initiation ATPase DnaA